MHNFLFWDSWAKVGKSYLSQYVGVYVCFLFNIHDHCTVLHEFPTVVLGSP